MVSKLITLVFLIGLLPGLALAQLRGVTKTQLGLADLLGSFNRNCIAYTVLGPCPIVQLAATHLLVSYFEPTLMIETTPRTGESILAGGAFDGLGGAGQQILAGLTGAVGLNGVTITAGGGASTSNSTGQSSLHFNEARVYTIPGIIGTACSGHCGDAGTFTVNYVSDADPLWRYGQPNASRANLIPGIGPLGVWGNLFPRVGFLSHGSKHVAGAAAAIRAAWIAFDPVGAAAVLPDRRIVTTPSTVAPVCWQLGYPQPLGGRNKCYPPGVHPAYWDRRLITLDSAMLHVMYAPKVC